jgi:hypothetical protein
MSWHAGIAAKSSGQQPAAAAAPAVTDVTRNGCLSSEEAHDAARLQSGRVCWQISVGKHACLHVLSVEMAHAQQGFNPLHLDITVKRHHCSWLAIMTYCGHLNAQVSSDLIKILEQTSLSTPQQMFDYFTEAFISIIFDSDMVANGTSIVSPHTYVKCPSKLQAQSACIPSFFWLMCSPCWRLDAGYEKALQPPFDSLCEEEFAHCRNGWGCLLAGSLHELAAYAARPLQNRYKTATYCQGESHHHHWLLLLAITGGVFTVMFWDTLSKSVVWKSARSELLLWQVMKHLTLPRQANGNRTEFFTQAEAFACIVSLEFVTIPGKASLEPTDSS